MKKHLLIQCIIIGLAGCLFFSGCVDKNVDYDMEGDTEAKQFQRGKTKVKQFADDQEWMDEWTVMTSKGRTVKCLVDADILVPAAEQMSVVEVKEKGFDKDYKKSMIKRIFDNEEVYYNDISHLTKKELIELRAKYKLLYETYPAGSYDWKKMRLGEKIQECDAALKESVDTHTLAEDFSMGEYWGKRAGIPYNLSFMEENMGIYSCRSRSILLFPKDVYQVCPQKFRETENLVYESWNLDSHGVLKENICELSEEEAKKRSAKLHK